MTAFSASYGRVCGRRKQTHCKNGHDLTLDGAIALSNRMCRLCRNSNQVKRRLRNPEKVKAFSRWTKLKMMYGVTKADYEAMFAAQKGCCKICRAPATAFKRPLGVDHDHETNEVRGLLCGNCNNGLGKFKDRPDLLIKAAVYLEQARKLKRAA